MYPSLHHSNSSHSVASTEDVDQQQQYTPSQHSSLSSSPASSHHQLGPSGRNEDTKHDATSLIKVAAQPDILDEDDQPVAAVAASAVATSTAANKPQAEPKEAPVTWMSLPKKGQLAILTIARLSEPLSERSLSAYVFYQLRSFDPSLPDSTISWQGGMLTAVFAAAQFLTAVWWGRAADTPWIGRKRVLLVGLAGTALASVGVGFSKSFIQAVIFRGLAGALNGNIGVMRTMISEMIQEKKFQSRAFLLLPMCFNIGVIIGPIMGGFLADPINSFPHVFGPGSFFGGQDGVSWMKVFPYGLPNLFSGIFIMISALAVVLGLDETHPARRNQRDLGRQAGKWLMRTLRGCRRRPAYSYTQLATNETELTDDPGIAHDSPHSRPSDIERTLPGSQMPLQPKPKPRSPFRAILIPNVVLTLLSHHLLALHVSSFNTLIFLFLPFPRSPPPDHFTFRFTGGLGLSSSKVGMATAIIGLIGFPLQIFVYPPLQAKLGTLKGYRTFLPFSAVAYILLPFLAILPNRIWLVWPALTIVLAAQVLSRTFALTSTVILINNSAPSPAVLGTVHGVAQSVSSGARMLGPTVGGWALGEGLKNNCVGAVWWAMACLVALNWTLLWFVFEGDGKGGRT